ncbi:Aspartyl-tRNA synthetase [Planctomycetales bacterium 10988]|nr:Aspartyl-tRNA synthetase [Planctomycetales bacterium 10988]
MNRYSTHTCQELRTSHEGETVRLSGWIHRQRDHGGILFIDLRDAHGVTQVVVRPDRDCFEETKHLRVESVITVTGKVCHRPEENINEKIPTGEVEVIVDELEVQSSAEILPLQVADENDVPESMRLKYRFLDLRRESMQKKIMLRSQVIASIREQMQTMDFMEIQTPILTKSSPEGARDYLVPSRVHPGKFYALPQAPQQFKQLLMVSGFPRYFQIAPCFRDEDARADRSPGEFYQLDMEMAFVEQDDVFEVIERLMTHLFDKYSDWPVTETPFPRIPYREAMMRYGSDKPDLRIPFEIQDVSEIFKESDFRVFRSAVEQGGVVRALPIPETEGQPRSFVDGLEAFAKENGARGLAYVVFPKGGGKLKGPVAKYLGEAELEKLKQLPGCGEGATCFLLAGAENFVAQLAGRLRVEIAKQLDRFEKNVYKFCWIVDYPMFEQEEETGKIEFSHNPFSMPQGGMDALLNKDPLDILAFQYDIVCNGVELSSGAIRNHRPDIMYKAFEIAGYDNSVVDKQFGGMIRAFQFGAPPHGGIAPGVDRIVMMLADETSIREVIAFPMTPGAEDLLMDAPSEVSPEQLKELHIRLELPKPKKQKNAPQKTEPGTSPSSATS